ncbi:hypothetical protein GCM10009116_10630 [Brevundimonas basaltis]|uniref:Uncharacterized protein n=1 Tax=Brevundimonas basaltis TaxID=472166 RepID=A0A7W8HY21_9CAUL|nr:hypothetical protein [Brevundimonas basaltis]MBB5292016.1 hypothetical protein [Brevundimonas basaltis]
MQNLRLVWPSRAGRWRKPAIVVLSVGLHALVLGLIGLRSLGLDGVTPQPVERAIYVEIEPRPLLEGEVARVRPPQERPDTASQAAPNPGAAAVQSNPFRSPDDEDDRPTSRLAAPGAPAPPADVGTAPWRVRPETAGDRVGRGLRTSPVGCASPNLLTAAERAICDDRFGARAAAAAPINGTGNPERDGRFAREGARALANYEARRRPLAGGTGNVGVQEGPGSNFGMGVAGAHLDPALRPDSTTNVRTRRDRERELEED